MGLSRSSDTKVQKVHIKKLYNFAFRGDAERIPARAKISQPPSSELTATPLVTAAAQSRASLHDCGGAAAVPSSESWHSAHTTRLLSPAAAARVARGPKRSLDRTEGRLVVQPAGWRTPVTARCWAAWRWATGLPVGRPVSRRPSQKYARPPRAACTCMNGGKNRWRF